MADSYMTKDGDSLLAEVIRKHYPVDEITNLRNELKTGLDMIAALHTNATQWHMDAIHWQKRGDDMTAKYYAEHEILAHYKRELEKFTHNEHLHG